MLIWSAMVIYLVVCALKLARSGITGKLFGIMESMYEILKNIKVSVCFQTFLIVTIGLMKGEAVTYMYI